MIQQSLNYSSLIYTTKSAYRGREICAPTCVTPIIAPSFHLKRVIGSLFLVISFEESC